MTIALNRGGGYFFGTVKETVPITLNSRNGEGLCHLSLIKVVFACGFVSRSMFLSVMQKLTRIVLHKRGVYTSYVQNAGKRRK